MVLRSALKYKTFKRNQLHGLMVKGYLRTLNTVILSHECMVSWSALKYETVKRNWLHGLMVREVFEDAQHSYFVLMSASWSYGLPWNMRHSNVTNSMVSWSGVIWRCSTQIFCPYECMVSRSALKYETVKRNWLHGLMVRGYLKTLNTVILS
jgi:hypothetical protein